MTEALKLRKQIKDKKPEFARQDAHKNKKLSRHWRKPKGLHSKMRRHRHGKPASVKPGYGSPSEAKGLHKSGLIPVIINNIKDIESLNKELHGAVIGSTVGTRKKIDILTKLKEKSIRALNVKDTEAFIKKAQDAVKARKEAKTTAAKQKEAKKKEKKPEKKKLTEKVTEETEKEIQKKEFDKVLTKREK